MTDWEETESIDSQDFDEWNLEEDDESVEKETEESNVRGQRAGGKRRSKGKANQLPLATCHKCVPKRGFRSLEGYKAHLKMHLVEELYQFAPCQSAFQEECNKVHKEVLAAIFSVTEKYTAGLSKEVANIVQRLLSTEGDNLSEFVNVVADSLWKCVPAPSKHKLCDFNHIYVKSVNQLLCDSSVRMELAERLHSLLCVDISQAAMQWFLAEYVRKVAGEAEAYYLRVMREPQEMLVYGSVEMPDVNRDNVDDSDMKESVYYVGGSVVKSVLSKSMRSLQNPKWNEIDTFIRTKVLVGDLVSEPESSVTEWTKSLNRGGLKFIGEPMWNFFMGLVTILRVAEKKDGSILHNESGSTLLL